MSEQVMVVRREDLEEFIGGREAGLIRTDLDRILAIISSRHFFIDRPTAEVSPQYKQIIPYVLIKHASSYFLLERTAKQTEARLHHKRSLGIGGHINPDTPTILGGLQKELDEEIGIDAPYELEFVGILNDDSTDVGRVHLGAVYIAHVAAPAVTIRETEKMTGSWTAASDLASSHEAMESWSQVVYDELISPRP